MFLLSFHLLRTRLINGSLCFLGKTSFVLQLRIPIDHQCERPQLPRFIQVDEALSVRARVIHPAAASKRSCIKELTHLADLHTRAPSLPPRPSTCCPARGRKSPFRPVANSAGRHPRWGICHLPPGPGKGTTYTSILSDSAELYDTPFPSGENRGYIWLNFDFRKTNGFRSASRGSIQIVQTP